ncbi:ComEC/Rec2 family competence protein [Oceanirhabdus sp. W0125-5]|uniref:ComEC/Rec2 family competence protein n=1 Tax=Oceanirhabdus sp. W0125-5 TaxID=2999116 RepID=UPI0022F321EB|nr:ComEC/Rec2 family competence protein [Oceanirhabdus sp. W0125-5]WBW95792.1 ComEC/Rec2 family competence protein [Oceanirhabdus sp. W0125-5]
MKSDEFYGKPMVIAAFFFNMGGILFLLEQKNIILFCVVLTCNIIGIYSVSHRKKALVLVLIIICGFFNVRIYFKVFLPYDIYDRVIITNKTPVYAEGEIRGKKVLLWNEKHIDIGEKVIIMGDFTCSPDYGKGYVGEYEVYRSKSSGRSLLYWSNKVVEEIRERLNTILSKEAYGYVNAMALGERRFLGIEETDRLKRLGIIHVLAVSGLHMILIFNIIGSVIKKSSIVLALCMVYTFIIGAPPSALRAVFMLIVFTLGKKVIRTYDNASALAFSSIIILLYRPYYLFNISYHLSFLALIGIVLFSKKIKESMLFLPTWLRKSLSMILSAQVFIIPYTGMMFKEINIGIFLGNLIIVPIAVIIIVFSFILVLLCKLPLIGESVGYIYNYCILIFRFITVNLGKYSHMVLKVDNNYAILYLSILFLMIYFYYKYKSIEDRMLT